MTDTKIKGTHNSRSIIAPVTLPATWEEARAQLITEGWPIDLGPLNLAGLDQKGTDLNKASLLKDATAALFGLGTGAVPDDVLAQIGPKIATAYNKSLVSIQAVSGSYKETGNEITIPIGFHPIFVAKHGWISKGSVWKGLWLYFDNTYVWLHVMSTSNYVSIVSGDWEMPGNSLRFAPGTYNDTIGETSHYVAFG